MELLIKNNITINAPAKKVWDVLTNPEQTKKYMFGCETVSDWKQGSTLEWKGNYEGKEMVFVKGNIVNIIPEKNLAYTTIDPNNTLMEDKPENYTRITFELSEKNNNTLLTLTQDHFITVKQFEHSAENWEMILNAINLLLKVGVCALFVLN